MQKLKSLDELKKIRDAAASETRIRDAGENSNSIIIAVGMATCGIAAGARSAMNALIDEIEKQGLNKLEPDGKPQKSVAVTATGCAGLCYAEPIVEVRIPGQPAIKYGHVDEARAREIIQKHIMLGELLNNAIVGQEEPA